ncbi:MAG: MFS transporter [Solirubrobacteraceae bacterium]|nr:MFS transporter [Solirubrobacteraceae bacterium]
MTHDERSELARIAEGRGAGPYRWVVLAGAAFGAAAFSGLRMGLPSLGPAIRTEFGLSLGQVGIAFAAVALGTMLTLIPWGMLADRVGERLVLATGLIGTAGAMVWAANAGSYAAFVAALTLAGAAGAAATGASGRAVMGWFGWRERGTALGLRQMALPLGGAIGSVVLPRLAGSSGLAAAFLSLAGAMAIAALVCAVLLREPPQRPAVIAPLPTTPPLRDRRQWRLGVGSAFLVLAQGSMLGFLVLYLVDQHGVEPAAAALVLAAAQLLGAAGRVRAGRVSDREERRIAPIRRRGLMSGALLLVMAVTQLGWPASPAWFAAPLGVAAAVATMTWNGLSFTAAGEIAGRARAGTAMSLQNTIVAVGSAVGAPLFGALVDAAGWPVAYAVLALGPLMAWLVLAPLEVDESSRVRSRRERIDASLAGLTPDDGRAARGSLVG